MNGVRVDKDDLKNAYKVRGSCYTFNGKFVRLVVPDGFDYSQFVPQVYGPGEELPPGVYTYLFPTRDRIICVPVKNKFEIGTVHYVLAAISEAVNVIAAGELLVQRNGTIYFNLLSGSYMQKWMTSRTGLQGACNEELRDLTFRMLQQQYRGNTIEYTTAELITETNVPVTIDDLDRYV